MERGLMLFVITVVTSLTLEGFGIITLPKIVKDIWTYPYAGLAILGIPIILLVGKLYNQN